MSELIETVFCKSDSKLRNNLSPHGPIFGKFHSNHQWIFRGHSSEDYDLLPVALRQGEWKNNESLTCRSGLPEGIWASQLFVEAKLLALFWEQSDAEGLPVPGESFNGLGRLNQTLSSVHRALNLDGHPGCGKWPDWDLLPLMALARHHGIPTRLLDWSRSAIVAAYFASTGSFGDEGNAAVWAFDSDYFRELVAGNEDQFRSRLWVVSAPRATNPNLHAQNVPSRYWTEARFSTTLRLTDAHLRLSLRTTYRNSA